MTVQTVVVGLLNNNSYLVVSEKGNAALIDAGMNYNLIYENLLNSKANLKYILLTHGHYDHVASVYELSQKTGAKVVISEPDAEMLSDYDKSLAYKFTRKFTPFEADITVKDGETVTLDELDFKFLLTPGHSKGSAVILCKDTMFSGDMLFAGTVGRTDIYGSDPNAMISSIKKLSRIEKDYKVLCGHGRGTTLAQEKHSNPYFIEYAQD